VRQFETGWRQHARIAAIAVEDPPESQVPGVAMKFEDTAAGLISQAENCDEFHRFSAEFDNWKIQSWLKPKEKALHFGIGAFNRSGALAVELGTFEGASALFTMAGMRHRGKGKLYSVDPHLGAPPFLGVAPWQFTLEKFRQNTIRAGLAPYVKSIVADSQIASSIWPSQPIDSVLIDGDHSYIGCLRDVECWGVKLKPGAFLLIDDAEDPALPELLRLIEDLKEINGIVFEALIEGIAVFRRNDGDSFAVLEELKNLRGLTRKRPWDMEFVQGLKPNRNYKPEGLGVGNDLLTAYQLGFLARCEPGNYAVTPGAPPSDIAIVDALIEARCDGIKLVVDPFAPSSGGFRMAVCSVDEALAFKNLLLPGGVLIARSSLPVSYENSIAERERLLKAGFEGCGWQEQIHWGFSRPHYLSADAIVEYISRDMS
jgi:predicted O-methyltransferase YrrM